jgi:acyl-CoA thioester hydrolase
MRAVDDGASGNAAFSIPVRVYWEDTDAGGIVYYANYFRFMERARTDWLRSFGIEQEALRSDGGVMFVVIDAQARFRVPARYGDLLRVTCEVELARGASITFLQNVVREAQPQVILVAGKVRIACLDSSSFKPRPVPERVLQEIHNAR